MKYTTYITLISFISLMIFPLSVRAEEITVSGNGSESNNEVQNSAAQTTTVSQNNDADIDNSIEVFSNTGNNTANVNTGGDTAITTGDTQTVVDVANSANTSTANVNNCCSQDPGSQATIVGNGTGSDNAVNVNSNTTTAISNSNTATITNNISGYANTGNNYGNNNTNGNVSIDTGKIQVVQILTNGPINISNVSASSNGDTTSTDNKVNISRNGSFSDNLIAFNSTNTTDIRVNNDADILNESLWILNTGKNQASDNTDGDVSITTGGIKLLVDILNGPINVSEVEVDCDCNEVEKPKDQPLGGSAPTPVTTTTTTSTSSGPSAPSIGGGKVLGVAVGKILPVTGNYSFLFLMIGNVALFFLGLVLRLRSGNSPGEALAL